MTDPAGGPLEITALGAGEYRIRLASRDGATSVVLELGDAATATSGRLADDAATAAATVGYLLAHQDAADLPPRVALEEVLAAYPDAAGQIGAMLD